MAFLDRLAGRPLGMTIGYTLFRDILAGTIAAVVTVVACISFAALIFQGSIAGGFALGLSALLIGTALTGMIVAMTTTLAPADAGPDTPAVAVMSVLAAGIAAQLSGLGATPQEIVVHVLMAITVATLVTGLLLVGLGWFRLGIWLRFVPYPVIGGFLAASGWLLITGGMEVMVGAPEDTGLVRMAEIVAAQGWPQFAVGTAFAGLVFVVRQKIESFLVLPIAFFVFVIALHVVLVGFGQVEALGGRQAWFLEEIGTVELWNPWAALWAVDIRWGVLAANAAEIGAVVGVTAVGMLLDVTSLEVARHKTADLDKELRINGIANVVTAAAGGAVGNLSLNGSILINEAGAATRLSGLVAAIVSGTVLLVGTDLAALVPTPLLGGLLTYLGLVILSEALLHSPAERSWTDLALAAAIMAVIVYFGYLLGVLLGVVGACLLFAFSYSRIGVVKRHLTRQNFSSNVERSPVERRILQEAGSEIHVFWLSGYIFFGSSNGLFEYVRRCVDSQGSRPVRYVILDFGAVPGVDTSAVLSLVKLKNYCDERGVTLLLADVTVAMLRSFKAAGFLDEKGSQRVFAARNDALEWCENRLLGEHELEEASDKTFEGWLEAELGHSTGVRRLMAYFERHELAAGEILFREGDPPDSVDLLASGNVAITITDQHGRTARLRRMAAQTVVGEMGFYRGVPRAATVVAEEPTVLYRMTREAFDRMQSDDPGTAAAFHRLIVRVLSDRLDFANREISALL